MPDRAEITAAVERYLAKKRVPNPPPVPAPVPVVAAPAPQPDVQAVDFVCEDDVRRALRDSKKIFIGPKTIVTPSARDLGNQHDVLVEVQRR